MIEEENLTKHWIKWLTKIKSIKTNELINHLNRVFSVRPLANTSLPKKTGIGQSKYRNLTLFHVVWSVPAKVFLTVTFSINDRLY